MNDNVRRWTTTQIADAAGGIPRHWVTGEARRLGIEPTDFAGVAYLFDEHDAERLIAHLQSYAPTRGPAAHKRTGGAR